MKRIILLGAGLLFAGLANAQTSMNPSFGIKAGLNVAKFAGDPDPDSEFRTGFSAGVFVNIPISTGFSFEPSGEFSQKGAEFTTTGDTEVKNKISYIDVPLMAKLDVTPSFGLFLGPQVSFFVDQETKVEDNGTSSTTEGDNDPFRKSLAGAKGGASYNFGPVALNASYATDLQNIHKDDTGNGDLKNQVINVGLAYRFR